MSRIVCMLCIGLTAHLEVNGRSWNRFEMLYAGSDAEEISGGCLVSTYRSTAAMLNVKVALFVASACWKWIARFTASG